MKTQIIHRVIVFGLIGAALSFVYAMATSYYAIETESPVGSSWKKITTTKKFVSKGDSDSLWAVELVPLSLGVYISTLQDWTGHDITSWTQGHVTSDTAHLPSWSRANSRPNMEKFGDRVYEVAAGWPVVSWSGEMREDNIHNEISFWFCWRIQNGNKTDFPLLIPFKPVFVGFVFDASVWGVMAWMIFNIVSSSHSYLLCSLRRRKGLCPTCAYNITDLTTCPECGNPVKVTQK